MAMYEILPRRRWRTWPVAAMGPALQQGLLAVATTRRQWRWSTRAAAALEDAGGGSEAGDGPGTAAGATGRGDQKMAAALEDTDSARARARVPARLQRGRWRRRGTTVMVPARVLSTSLYFCWAEAQDGSIRGSYSALCSVSSDLQWMDGCARLQNAVERADCRGSGSG